MYILWAQIHTHIYYRLKHVTVRFRENRVRCTIPMKHTINKEWVQERIKSVRPGRSRLDDVKKSLCYTIYATKPSTNALWIGLGVNSIFYRYDMAYKK